MASAPPLPTQFFTAKTIYTLSGAAGAVWLICLVLASVVPKDVLVPWHWRVIALGISEAFAVVLILRAKGRSMESWLIGLLNGLLIFVNASGVNAVSQGLAFADKEDVGGMLVAPVDHQFTAGLLDAVSEMNWWPDKASQRRISELEVQNEQLLDMNRALQAGDVMQEKVTAVEEPKADLGCDERLAEMKTGLARLQEALDICNARSGELAASLAACESGTAELRQALANCKQEAEHWKKTYEATQQPIY